MVLLSACVAARRRLRNWGIESLEMLFKNPRPSLFPFPFRQHLQFQTLKITHLFRSAEVIGDMFRFTSPLSNFDNILLGSVPESSFPRLANGRFSSETGRSRAPVSRTEMGFEGFVGGVEGEFFDAVHVVAPEIEVVEEPFGIEACAEEDGRVAGFLVDLELGVREAVDFGGGAGGRELEHCGRKEDLEGAEEGARAWVVGVAVSDGRGVLGEHVGYDVAILGKVLNVFHV